MLPGIERARPWTRSPRGLVVALGATTVLSAAVLTWFAWEIVQQDRAAEAQRDRERLDLQADQVVRAIDLALTEAAESLAASHDSSSPSLERLAAEGVVLDVTATTVTPAPPATLCFYPVVPARPEPPASVFAEGETAEFRARDGARAASIYRSQSRSADPAIRAGALMRLGGVLRQSRQHDAARMAYREMAALGDVPIAGLPADLIARDAAWRLERDMGQHDAARETARLLYQDLKSGRWLLTRGQYEFHADEAATAAGIEPADDARGVALAEAASEVWRLWQARPPSRGRTALRTAAMSFLVVWSATADRMTAWIVEPARLAARADIPSDVRIALSDAEGVPVAGDIDRSSQTIVRSTAETRLPWTLHVTRTGPAAESVAFTRGRLIIGGLVVMLGFLGASAYFIGRAVKQEMELARLQSGFVAAVSHEFRTPLAAMRQVSELLAAGRVPTEARRQQNYEALAAESRRLQRLVENLLDFGKLEAGGRLFEMAPVDPRLLVERVVDEFRSQMARPRCRIEIDGDASPPFVVADAEALSLALRNLLDNAVKYSPGDAMIRVGWTLEGDRVAFRVSDEGPGIAIAEQSQIFQKFVRGTAAAAGNVKGVGLGLAMVQHIVSGHGGEVRVSSEPGRGSTFTVLLPAAVAGEAESLNA